MELDQLIEGFSSPNKPINDKFFQEVSILIGTEFFTAALQKEIFADFEFEYQIVKNYKTCIDNLKNIMGWEIPLGMVRTHLYEKGNGLISGIMSLILTGAGALLNTQSDLQNFQIDFKSPIVLYFQNKFHWNVSSLNFNSNNGYVLITTIENSSVQTVGFQLNSDLKPGNFESPEHEESITFLFSYPDYLCFLEGYSRTLEADREQILNRFNLALGHIKQVSPEYFYWIKRMLKAVVILRKDENNILSGSNPNWFGVVNISDTDSVEGIVEMLVHEISHQYYYFGKMISQYFTCDEEKLYYSPIKNTMRPVWAILLAYHAFANVIIFFRLSRTSNGDFSNFISKNEDFLLPKVLELQVALDSHPGFTIEGENLWKPLKKLLS